MADQKSNDIEAPKALDILLAVSAEAEILAKRRFCIRAQYVKLQGERKNKFSKTSINLTLCYQYQL